MAAAGPEIAEAIPSIIDQNKLIKVFETYLTLQKNINGYDTEATMKSIKNAEGLCNGFSAFVGDRLDTANIQNLGKNIEALNKELSKLKVLFDEGFDKLDGTLLNNGEDFKAALLREGRGNSEQEKLTYGNNETVAILEEIISNVVIIQGSHSLHKTLQSEVKPVQIPEEAKQAFLKLISMPVNTQEDRNWVIEEARNWAISWAKESGVDENTLILDEKKLEKIREIYNDPHRGPEKAIKELEWIAQNNQPGKIGVQQKDWHTLLNLMAKETTLLLMSELSEGKVPEPGKMYLEKTHDNKLRYIVMSSSNQMIDETLDINIGNRALTPEVLVELKDEILEETSTRGHASKKKQLENTFQLYFVYKKEELSKALTLLFNSFDPASNKIINLSSQLHATMAYKVGNYFYHWDTNFGKFHGPLSLENAPEIIANLMIKQVYEPFKEATNGRYHLNIGVFEQPGAKPNTLSAQDIVNTILKERGTPQDSQELINDALINAARFGDLALMEFLFNEKGADLNAKDNIGTTVLDYVAQAGHGNILQFLLTKKFTIDEPWKMLLIAARNGRAEVVESLLTLIEITLKQHVALNINVRPHLKTVLDSAISDGHRNVVELLLKKEANLIGKDNIGGTILHLAALLDHGKAVKFLLDAEPNLITVRDRDGNTALDLAVMNGHENTVRVLLDADPNWITARNSDGKTALDLAAMKGHDPITKLLSKRLSDELHLAAKQGRQDKIEFLLANGANLQTKDIVKNTALHFAAEEGHIRIVEFLLEKGINLDAQNLAGQTALHLAVTKGQMEVVELLLTRGADLQDKDFEDNTVLHIAAYQGHTPIVKLLLSRILQNNPELVDSENEDGHTALYRAIIKGHHEVVELLIQAGADLKGKLGLAARQGHSSIIDLLIQKGADLMEVDNLKQTALHIAVLKGRKEAVQLLLRHNPRLVLAENSDGKTALQIAAANGQTEIVDLLLQGSVDLPEIEALKQTALYIAAANGQTEVVDRLLNNGVGLAVTDKDGKTALHHAAAVGQKDVVALLINKGADVAAKDVNGATPLHLAAFNGHQEVVASFMISRRVNMAKMVTERDNAGNTPLHLAAFNGHQNIISTLFARQALPTVINNEGQTPLDLARMNGHDNAVHSLRNKLGFMLLAAVKTGSTENVESLLQFDPNLLATDSGGGGLFGRGSKDNTALHIAVEKGFMGIVDLLLRQNNAELIAATNAEGKTALDLATEPKIIELFKAQAAQTHPVQPVQHPRRFTLGFDELKGNRGEIRESPESPPLTSASPVSGLKKPPR